MDWNQGFEASFYMARVNAITWHDTGHINITGASITKSTDGLRESANVDCRNFDYGIEQLVRLWAIIRQNGAVERHALFTGYTSCPKQHYNGMIVETPLECYSVLKAADDVLLPRGWYAGAGRNGAELVGELLSVNNTPVTIQGESPVLMYHIVAESGETNRTMADKILQAIGWRLRIAGDGTVTVCELPTDVSARFGQDYDVIEPEFDVEQDLFSCPNIFRAISNGMSAVAVDDSDGQLSTISRGREVWAEETSCSLNDSETLAEYAVRRLRELQAVTTSVPYTRRYHPDVVPGDMVDLSYPGHGLTGTYTVQEQKITVGNGIPVEESVYR